jgi:prophage DNA circulation protein
MGLFEDLPAASWRVGNLAAMSFPIEGDISEKGGNRLVPHKRAYRKGAKISGTGLEPREWTFTAVFNNTITESKLDNGRPLYPDVLRAIVASFGEQETGTLTLPTVGDVRACAWNYTRIESTEKRDEGALQLHFIEDNEESAATISFQQPSVRATVEGLAEQTTFSAASVGALDRDLVQVKGKSIDIVSLLLAPGRAVADLQTRVTDSRRALQRVRGNQEVFARQVGAEHDEPRGSEFWRNLIRLQDLQAKSVDEKFASRPRVRAFVVDVESTSILEIAARLKQDATELLDLNSERLADPFLLERGDVIRVFETAPA